MAKLRSFKTILLGTMVCAMLMVGGSISLAASTPTPTAPVKTGAGLIVFQSNRAGNDDIYVINPDGTGLSQLTNDPAPDQLPAWSPDGKHIAFASDRDGNPEIYVMSANGSNVRRLTKTGSAREYNPIWSPDGKRIACVAEHDLGTVDIVIMNADGSNEKVLATDVKGEIFTFFLSWSPDGKQIAFVAGDTKQNGNSDIYVVNVSDSSTKRLTSADGDDISPAWSPNGKQIAFSSNRNGPPTLFVMDADGGNQKAIGGDRVGIQPSWSPDGQQLIYTGQATDAENSLSLFIVDIDGGNRTSVTYGAFKDFSPSWSTGKATIKLPLPTLVPLPTSKAASGACPISADKTYGYSETNPVNTGGGDFGGPPRERAYLDKLRGPKGEEITYDRKGSFARNSDGVILDIYEITYAGLKKPIVIYVNEYSEEPPQVPVGFTCASR